MNAIRNFIRVVCWALNGGVRCRPVERCVPLLAEYLWTFNRPKIYHR